MVAFRAFRHLNGAEPPTIVSSRSAMDVVICDRYFADGGLYERLARALARRRAISVKEWVESAEFFERVRRRLATSRMVDFCAGHGLTGLLFACFERKVDQVLLLDRRCPPSFNHVLEAVLEVAPWVQSKVQFREQKIGEDAPELTPGTSVVAVHACGALTDRALDWALNLKGPVAVMPCCYPQRTCAAPPALLQALGAPVAHDVDRTYRMESSGYRVSWTAIPGCVTPMSRILIARPG